MNIGAIRSFEHALHKLGNIDVKFDDRGVTRKGQHALSTSEKKRLLLFENFSEIKSLDVADALYKKCTLSKCQSMKYDTTKQYPIRFEFVGMTDADDDNLKDGD